MSQQNIAEATGMVAPNIAKTTVGSGTNVVKIVVFMLVPELQPFVKLKRCDGKSVAKVFYCGVSKKPFPQYAEDEQEILSSIALDYRVKSVDSILLKYERYYPDHQTRKVFNDILGFRAFCDSYDQILEEESSQFRIADMSSGKAVDDGYRGVHVYYQKSGKYYPIEIQFNTLFDRQLNNWLHDYLYKKDYPIETGRIMREKYESGLIRNEHEFKEVLNNVLSGSERS